MRVSAVSEFGRLPEAMWDICFPGEVENLRYYQACAAARPAQAHVRALIANGTQRPEAVAPLFRMEYALHTSIQDGWLGAAMRQLDRRFPRLFRLPMLGLGSPFAERCHCGFPPDMDEADRLRAADRLLDLLERQAHLENIGLTVIKDIHEDDLPAFRPHLLARGYTRMSSLPVAVLHLPYATFDDYLASLSRSTRKDMKRKLRDAAHVEIEYRHDISDIGDEIFTLYEQTRLESPSDYGDFEQLPADYFTRVVAALAPRAFCVCYRIDGVLAAFNLLMVEEDRVIDKFLGMNYPLARTHDLYFISWMENVRYCIANGKTRLQTGQGTFANKLRLGSVLEPMHNYFRHRSPMLNAMLGAISPLLGFEELDPSLQAARRPAPGRVQA